MTIHTNSGDAGVQAGGCYYCTAIRSEVTCSIVNVLTAFFTAFLLSRLSTKSILPPYDHFKNYTFDYN